jgi:hypothetical protein
MNCGLKKLQMRSDLSLFYSADLVGKIATNFLGLEKSTRFNSVGFHDVGQRLGQCQNATELGNITDI